MSINATAVVKKETKVDPKKPNEKTHHASLSLLNEDGKEYGHVISVGCGFAQARGGSYTRTVTRASCRVRKGRRNQFSSEPRKRRSNQKSWVRPQGSMTGEARIQ